MLHEFRPDVFQYQRLKDFIANINAIPHSELCENSEDQCDDCSICLEPAFRSITVTTSCRHSFHATCLINYLATRPGPSCPLCRCSPGRLVPQGVDGHCLQFLAMVCVSANAVQRCHDDIIRSIEHSLEPHTDGARRHRKLGKQEASNAIAKLEALIEHDRVNMQGFHEILNEFDKHTGFEVTEATMEGLRMRGFYVDSQSEDGRCAQLMARLKAIPSCHRKESILRGLTRALRFRSPAAASPEAFKLNTSTFV